MNMRKKILIPMAAVAVVCSAVIGFLGALVVGLFVGDFNDERLSNAYTLASTVIEDYKNNAQRASATLAENVQLVTDIQNHLAGGERQPLVDTAVSLMAATGVDSLTIMDTTGTVLVRARDPDHFGDSLSYQSNVKNALQGKQYTTMEEGTAVRLSVVCGMPVYGQDKHLIGALHVGYRLDQNQFVDYIKHLTNTEVTVFLRDTQVSTTVLDEKGQRTTGVQAPREVSGQVLGGNDYIGKATTLDKELLAHYFPLYDAEGSVLGMLFVGLDTSETDARMVQDTWIMIGLVLLLGILSVFVSGTIASRLSRPVREISDKAKQLAAGDVNIALSIATNPETKDEVRILAKEFQEMIQTINQQADILSTIANGDYSVSIPVRSEHDIINRAINRLVDRNNTLLAEINAAAMQVSVGSKQIADGAQSLAQGSTEQASSIEELSASISEIAEQTKRNADIAREAAVLSGTIRGNAEKGNAQMDQMMQAVKEINDASNQIEKVIKIIDDIAFQTNILALNAAVEAARAGQYGKGFAVVAEEVRNLAAKSAAAAKDTGGLIESSIEKTNFGLDIATETSASLQEIVQGINRSAEIAAQIARSSDEQAGAIAQINTGIDQVAQVVQQNSATAEESAAASVEMSEQSDTLAHLISQFKLKDKSGSPPSSFLSESRKKILTMPEPAFGLTGEEDDPGRMPKSKFQPLGYSLHSNR